MVGLNFAELRVKYRDFNGLLKLYNLLLLTE